jgi:hypothetical protein
MVHCGIAVLGLLVVRIREMDVGVLIAQVGLDTLEATSPRRGGTGKLTQAFMSSPSSRENTFDVASAQNSRLG